MSSHFEYTDNQDLIAELNGFQTTRELCASASYRQHRARLVELLETPRLFAADDTQPLVRDFVRIAHWNIEKGKHLDAVLGAFRQHAVLRWADLISLNEVDVGMNRSGQRFVARELGAALRMHVAFAPAYLEFSKGYGEDLEMPGTDTIALQGNAILSRYPLSNVRIIKLPACFDHFNHSEKRIGGRNAVAAEVEIGERRLSFVSTHLEVRNSPACRARQMAAIIADLEQTGAQAAIIAGDFNSNTFSRGGRWRTLRGFARLMSSDPEALARQLAAPQSGEPLFALLHDHGFTERGSNSAEITCRVPMRVLEDSSRLPRAFARAIERQFQRYNYQLDFRLDWIIGRGVRPLSDDEMIDGTSNIASLSPQTIAGLKNGRGGPASDHDPITADLKM
jgi:endonuclease/exonuclease/phosphatase family metal-dependent hydrolase